jgi:enoyl-CoA hydratase
MTTANLLVEKEKGITTLTLNRGSALNAFNADALNELKKAIEDFSGDAFQKVAILTGSGKAFSTGADIKELDRMSSEEIVEWCVLGSQIFNSLTYNPKPVVAAVNGYAVGGGCELALACDFRIASENAVFAFPEVTLGWIPGWGGTRRLSSSIGLARAKEILMLGRRVAAPEALEIGLVNRVVPPDSLMKEAHSFALQLAAKNPLSLTAIKYLLSDKHSAVPNSESLLEALTVSLTSKMAYAKEKIKEFEEKTGRKR